MALKDRDWTSAIDLEGITGYNAQSINYCMNISAKEGHVEKQLIKGKSHYKLKAK